MAINKFQRSRLTFNFSAKVASTYYNIVSSETIRPIELKFHMKTPYDRLAKIYTNCTGHMTKMATTPIYGKKPFSLNIFYLINSLHVYKQEHTYNLLQSL